MRTPFRLKADSVEACNCRHGCNCQFGGFPNEGKCEFVIGFQVIDGHFGTTSLNGVRAAVIAKYPKAIHEGDGRLALFVDERATPDQVAGFATIVSGKQGGMPWEALAGTITRFEGPISRLVEIEVDGERSMVHIPGVIDLRLTPLKDPVSGKDKEVHIVYPRGGFFWNEAKVATSSAMRVDYGDLRMNWPDRYASQAQVNWTNQ